MARVKDCIEFENVKSSFGKGNGLPTTAAPVGKPKFQCSMDVTTSYVRFTGLYIAENWKIVPSLKTTQPQNVQHGCLLRRSTMYNAYKNTLVLSCCVYFQLFRVLSSMWEGCSIFAKTRSYPLRIVYPQWKMLVVHVSTPLKFLSCFMLVLGGIFSSTDFSHTYLPHDKLSEQIRTSW